MIYWLEVFDYLAGVFVLSTRIKKSQRGLHVFFSTTKRKSNLGTACVLFALATRSASGHTSHTQVTKSLPPPAGMNVSGQILLC